MDDGLNNKKSKSVEIFKEENEMLSKENNLLRERIIELEIFLEVKQSGRLKHLKPWGEELECEKKVINSSNPIRENKGEILYLCNESDINSPIDYLEFQCTAL